MRARLSSLAVVISLALVAVAPAALARSRSLYRGHGPRPGPDVLYAAPAFAPQLENVGVWFAAPILVSGASAYRRGEFLYQDFLYDDHGDAATGQPVGRPAPLVAVDPDRRQIEVRVPHAAWDPTGQVVRLAAGVGLWDKANGRYLLPQAAADATHPGGSGTALSPAAFFNVAFRYAEPMPLVGDPAGTAAGPAWWADKGPGPALAAR